MINIMSPGADTSVATQQKVYALARKLSPSTLKGSGAEPEGWAKGLNQLGFGPYVVAVEPTRNAAISPTFSGIRKGVITPVAIIFEPAGSVLISGSARKS